MKRYHEIDLARAVPLLFLPFVHCYEMFISAGYFTDRAIQSGEFFLYLCAFGPSVFMTILGMNIAFSSHTSAPELARRGIRTILIAIGLNILRYVLPGIVSRLMGMEDGILMGIFLTTFSDILPFAGMTFLFFALMKKWKVAPRNILLISLLLLAVHTLISPAEDWESDLLPEIVGNFVHVTELSAFPLLAWLVYPAVGYLLGIYMKSLPDEDALRVFYNRMMLASAVALVTLCIGMNAYGLDFLLIAAAPANRNITDLFNILLDLAVAGIWFGVFYYIYRWLRRVASEKLLKKITDFSRGIMIFYIFQWIFVGWVMFLFGPKYRDSFRFGLPFALIWSVVILILSCVMTKLTQNYLDRKKRQKAVTA